MNVFCGKASVGWGGVGLGGVGLCVPQRRKGRGREETLTDN